MLAGASSSQLEIRARLRESMGVRVALALADPHLRPRLWTLVALGCGSHRVYFAAARSPRALWEVPAGGHTGALSAVPGEYERRGLPFFDSALLGGR